MSRKHTLRSYSLTMETTVVGRNLLVKTGACEFQVVGWEQQVQRLWGITELSKIGDNVSQCIVPSTAPQLHWCGMKLVNMGKIISG